MHLRNCMKLLAFVNNASPAKQWGQGKRFVPDLQHRPSRGWESRRCRSCLAEKMIPIMILLISWKFMEILNIFDHPWSQVVQCFQFLRPRQEWRPGSEHHSTKISWMSGALQDRNLLPWLPCHYCGRRGRGRGVPCGYFSISDMCHVEIGKDAAEDPVESTRRKFGDG